MAMHAWRAGGPNRQSYALMKLKWYHKRTASVGPSRCIRSRTKAKYEHLALVERKGRLKSQVVTGPASSLSIESSWWEGTNRVVATSCYRKVSVGNLGDMKQR